MHAVSAPASLNLRKIYAYDIMTVKGDVFEIKRQ
jgi:hypothetical protein